MELIDSKLGSWELQNLQGRFLGRKGVKKQSIFFRFQLEATRIFKELNYKHVEKDFLW